MIVRPEEISASSAPSTSPLNICETKLAQLITVNHACLRAASLNPLVPAKAGTQGNNSKLNVSPDSRCAGMSGIVRASDQV